MFQSYCTSFYGCELWQLNLTSISSVCATWWKSLRKIWDFSYDAHCCLLPLLGHCWPVFGETCRRSMNFIKSCVSLSSVLIRSIAMYSFTFSRCNSLIGHNLLFSAQHYNCLIQDILYGNVNSIIHNHLNSFVGANQVETSCMN